MPQLHFFILAFVLLVQVAHPQANLVRNPPPPPRGLNGAPSPQGQNRSPPPQQRLNAANAIRNNRPHPSPEQTTTTTTTITTPINQVPPPPPNQIPDPNLTPNPQPTQSTSDHYIHLKNWERSFDGTGNNLQFTNWGSTGQSQSRYCPNNYEDGLSVMRSDLPNPRELSNALGDIRLSPGGILQLSNQNRNMLFPIWGQFLDHDIALTSFADHEPVPIPVPKCDKYFDPECTGTQELPFMRSAFDPNQALRTQINLNTAWIDGSQIYGSSKDDADALRAFQKGKLLTTEGNLLPKDGNGFYISGDIRTNQNVGLTVLHTIFLREHNRICNIIGSRFPNLTDEDIYQMARNYVIALLQKISYDEFLPNLLGKAQQEAWIGPYIYQSNINPDLFTEFNTAGFRIGHSLMNSPYRFIDNQGNILKRLNFGQIFQNPDLVNNQNLAHIMNGLLRVRYKERSLELIDDLRNFLVSGQFGSMKIDLFAANIQRGRDHGICSYKAARDQLNLPSDSFAKIFNNPEFDNDPASRIQEQYWTLDRVDLWVGIVGQKSMEGSDMGEVGARMVAAQFKKIRNGDRFWYENVMAPYSGLLREIENTLLGDVIKRNSRVMSVNHQSFRRVV